MRGHSQACVDLFAKHFSKLLIKKNAEKVENVSGKKILLSKLIID